MSIVLDVLGYELSWFDQVSGLSRILYLKFFIDDDTIEIVEENKAFLKRIYYPSVRPNDLYVGNTISIYNRVMSVNKYANKATEEYMKNRELHFITIVNKIDSRNLGSFLKLCSEYKLNIGKTRTTSSSFSLIGIDVRKDSIVIETVALGNSIDKNEFINRSSNIFQASTTINSSAEQISVCFIKKCVVT